MKKKKKIIIKKEILLQETVGQQGTTPEIQEPIGQDYYNYEKIFMQLVGALNKCETKSEMDSFIRILLTDFKKSGAPKSLIDYLHASINSKTNSLTRRNDLDYTKLIKMSQQ